MPDLDPRGWHFRSSCSRSVQRARSRGREGRPRRPPAALGYLQRMICDRGLEEWKPLEGRNDCDLPTRWAAPKPLDQGEKYLAWGSEAQGTPLMPLIMGIDITNPCSQRERQPEEMSHCGNGDSETWLVGLQVIDKTTSQPRHVKNLTHASRPHSSSTAKAGLVGTCPPPPYPTLALTALNMAPPSSSQAPGVRRRGSGWVGGPQQHHHPEPDGQFVKFK